MLLIFLISGVGGNLVGGIFSSDYPTMGSSGAVFGLLGVKTVDLFQSWQILGKHRVRRLVLLVLEVAIFLMIGTLPWIVNNWTHIGGFVFGVLAGICFVPYLSFGAFDRIRKRCLVLVCFPVLVAMLLVGFIIFFEVQISEFCGDTCRHFNCIPWTKDFCDTD